MATDNQSNKVTYIKKTGAEVISNDYVIDISTLLDSTSSIGTSDSDDTEITVIRQFDSSSITPSITADEQWSAWSLPNSNSAGSSMYSLSSSTITFSTTAADWSWTTAQSGRSADVALPVIASGDTIYVLRKTISKSKLVQWTSGSKIRANTLNLAGDQYLQISQELLTFWDQFHNMHPSIGRPDGLCPLDASGLIPSTHINTTVLGLETELGIQGVGSTADKFRLDLDGDSLTASASGVKVDTQDSLSSSSTTKPLSAKQGKELNDLITSLGTGIVYKGGVNVAATYDLGTASAGWTVTHTAAGTTSRGSGWSIDTTGDGSADAGNVATGTVLRYDGSLWDVVQSSSNLLADGSVGLTGAWDATGGTITVDTQSASDNTTKVATTAFVQQEISGTNLSELSDVDTDVADTAGNMVYWDGGSWADIALNTTTPGSNKIVTTGDPLSSMSDVMVDTGSAATNQVLSWDGNSWEPTTLETTSFAITVGGNSVTADMSSEVHSSFGDANLGFSGESAVDTSVVGILDFMGQTRYIGGGTTLAQSTSIYNRKHVVYRNGTIKFNRTNSDNQTMLSNSATSALQTTLSSSAKQGQMWIEVADETGYNVGDLIEVQARYSEANDSEVWFARTTSTSNRQYSYFLGIISRIDATANRIYFTESLPCFFEGTTTDVRRFGGSSNGINQLQNVVFENMVFEDANSHHYLLGTDAFTFTEDSGTFTFDVPSSCDIQEGGRFFLHGVDTSSGGVNLTTNTEEDDFWQDLNINSGLLVDSRAGDTITATINGGYVWYTSSGTSGGAWAHMITSRHTAITLKWAYNVVFKNCTFKGWNKNGIVLSSCHSITFDGCTFEQIRPNTLSYGAIVLTEGTTNTVIKNCTFRECTRAITSDVGGSIPLRNITIDDCDMECSEPIYIKSCAGKVKIRRNEIKGYVIDSRRNHINDSLNSSTYGNRAPQWAIDVNLAHDLTITDNIIDHLRRCPIQSDTTRDTSTFWGEGTGLITAEASNVDGGGALVKAAESLPWFRYGIRVQLQIDQFQYGPDSTSIAGSQYLRHAPKLGCDISRNRVAMWNSYGISVEHTYLHALGGFQACPAIRIDDNTISGTGEGITTGFYRPYDAAAKLVENRNMFITRNTVALCRLFTSAPGLPWTNKESSFNPNGHPDTYGVLLGQDSSGGSGGVYAFPEVSNNLLTCFQDTGIGIDIGVDDEESTIGTLVYGKFNDNNMIGWSYAIAARKAYDDSAHTICKWTTIIGNTFSSPGTDNVAYQNEFLNSGSNNTLTRNIMNT